MVSIFCCIKRKSITKNEPIIIPPLPMIVTNPIYYMADSFISPLPPENKERIIPNRKSKAEMNEEFYNHSKEALKDLDNYLLESSYVFGFE
jgi:hypothetical protein